VSIVDFLGATEIFNLNLVKLVHYIDKSKIGFKLRGFSQRNFGDAKKSGDDGKKSGVGAFLGSISQNFISAENISDKFSSSNKFWTNFHQKVKIYLSIMNTSKGV
jgi:hypothetical protein